VSSDQGAGSLKKAALACSQTDGFVIRSMMAASGGNNDFPVNDSSVSI
jgi:hypothetical protein